MADNVQYYVEGEDEKRFLEVLKTSLQVIVPGKIQVFNVANKQITKTRLLTLKKDTVVVLVFDTDTVNLEIIRSNIELIKSMPNVKEVLTILQVKNLEDELVRACKIKRVEELLGVKTLAEFKARFLKISNLDQVLIRNMFDIEKVWIKLDSSLTGFKNDGERLKK